ncbi:MAG: hypothetical protein WCV90_06160 [Candidatus Woesearchaeota archaeon]
MDMSKLNGMICNMIVAGQKAAQFDDLNVKISTAEACKVSTSKY